MASKSKSDTAGVRRRNSMSESPEMSELRIVLLGKNVLENNRVGNFILGRAEFETGSPPVSVDHHSERVRGQVEGRPITVINTPDLFHPQLTSDQLSMAVKECVSLSDPGPHVFILVLQPDNFTEEDRHRVRFILKSFSDQALNHTMVITTDESSQHASACYVGRESDPSCLMIKHCKMRHKKFEKVSTFDQSQVLKLLEKIDKMLEDSEGDYHSCEVQDDTPESSIQPEDKLAMLQGRGTAHPAEEKAEKNNDSEECKQKKKGGIGSSAISNPPDQDGEECSTEDEQAKLFERQNDKPGTEEMSEQRKGRDHEEDERSEIEDLMNRLHLNGHVQHKLKTADILDINSFSLQLKEPQAETELVNIFLQKLLTMDYRARYTPLREQIKPEDEYEEEEEEGDYFDALISKRALDDVTRGQSHIHPMDVQMAVFHCADRFLQQFMVTKLSQCQYALPLLVPNPFTQQIEFPLWTFRQVKKSWRLKDISGKVTSKTTPIYRAETPMVFFFRLGSVSSSKSQLMNSLINEKHNTFFHRHCPGSSKTCLLMDGVVEIAWYCPSGKDTDHFTDCVAFCNLHGDAVMTEKQREIMNEKASVNVVFLPDLGNSTSVENKTLVQKLLKAPKPLICLLTEDSCVLGKIGTGKYRMGMKDRNQSDVCAQLRKAIKECLKIKSNMTKVSQMFKVEDVARGREIRVDEEDEDCKRGKEAALQIMNLLEGEDLSSIKQKHLPCQGKVWHDWCQKSKELHRLQGNNIEVTRSSIQDKMRQLRDQQKICGFSELMEPFVEKLRSLPLSDKVRAREKMYFLKWIGILMDELTSDTLSDLHHMYDEKWSKVLELKKKHDQSDQLSIEQAELKSISDKLNAATLGQEHILREVGQIYEAWASQWKKRGEREHTNISDLPGLAAELLISGHPMELMDGDAAHVPLIWVSDVLDEVIKRLGDQRVFVLSVLGIQSSGKSTMLNAMFGLQFAVSAGRCTRGVFMQLIRVTEEMKAELKFDYILVVDTEGLRALEFSGRATRHHDNELSTFVVGLGNMTLVNIYGESLAEIQDILQIVVQAFLRMKRVSLSPSCVFVHQNVADVTAGEKNMEGRRCLQEKLDEMTKLAAKEEDSDAECFSDVIDFDVQTDVKYFTQLWEGDPPMAPPNPSYSENMHELKKTILSKATKSNSITLSQFKVRIKDLWDALLNENFVFSFKNTVEIAVYRKLEEEYGKWTWNLRSAMLSVEDKLQNRIKNKKLHKIEEKDLVEEMRTHLREVEELIQQYFEDSQDSAILIQWRKKFHEKIQKVHSDLIKKARQALDDIFAQMEISKNVDEKKNQYKDKLFEKSKDLASELKHKSDDKTELKRVFDTLWAEWVKELTKDAPCIKDIDIDKDMMEILSEIHEQPLVVERLKCEDYKTIATADDYTNYVTPHFKPLTPDDQDSIKKYIISIYNEMLRAAHSKPVSKRGYNIIYIQETAHLLRFTLMKNDNDKFPKYQFNKQFTVDLSLFVCSQVGLLFQADNRKFIEANDPLKHLENMKTDYYNIFQGFCQDSTTAAVVGGLICSELRKPILVSVYSKAANDIAGQMRSNVLAFNGDRSNLEKHILKSLAEEENFDKFMQYIDNPKEYYENFINDRVKEYMTADNPKAITMIKGHIKYKQQCIITAAQTATAQVKQNKGDANMWLKSFSDCLTDELECSTDHLSGQNCQDITDFDLLEEVVKRELNTVIEELNSSFTSLSDLSMEMFRERPDEILIKHFCQCCWEKCPFCKAVCTNTVEGHPGDHSVPFHRPNALIGWHFKETLNFSVGFCTSLVSSCGGFCLPSDSNKRVPFKKYKSAGKDYANWSITPDHSELPYWKWFLCRFQTELETRYGNKTFQGTGEIPTKWRSYTREDAIESLDKYN